MENNISNKQKELLAKNPVLRKKIKEVQNILLKIDNGQDVFFNISQYEQLGLVKRRRTWGLDPWGNRACLSVKFYLTNKAKRYLNLVI